MLNSLLKLCSPEIACMLVHFGSLVAAFVAVSCMLTAACSASDQTHIQTSHVLRRSTGLTCYRSRPDSQHSVQQAYAASRRFRSSNMAHVRWCNLSGRSCMFDEIMPTDVSVRGRPKIA